MKKLTAIEEVPLEHTSLVNECSRFFNSTWITTDELQEFGEIVTENEEEVERLIDWMERNEIDIILIPKET